LLLQVDVHHRVRRRDNPFILNKVAQVTVFFLSHGRFQRDGLFGDF
jgi:hypothetical protein